MRTFASVLFLCFFIQASAQRECAAYNYNATKRTAATEAAERFIKQQSLKVTSGIAGSESGTSNTPVIHIPVVAHVLYNTAAQNISDAQIQSGIDALNRDFRKKNKDTANIPQAFKAAAADVQIEFHLATADPYGVATTGIVRKQTAAQYFEMDDKIKFSAMGGDDAWDSKMYLNIWLGNTRRLLGYATMPGGDEIIDGLVINVTAFGTLNMKGPYNLGRTVVHETGHWLGLRHIWGDEPCGDDLVGDTPKQGGYTAGCPNTFRSSCDNGTAGDMYMNYMDFSNDACMNMFTNGQKSRMRALFASGGPRQSLLASMGLNQPWAEAAPLPKEDTTQPKPFLHSYPNPTSQKVTLQFNTTGSVRGILYLINGNGIALEKIAITSTSRTISLSKFPAGIYYLQGIVGSTKVVQKLVKL